MASVDKKFFDQVGGWPTLRRVHKVFYDKAYADPWLSQYFTDKPQQHLEDQQSDFMAALMGAPNRYCGKTPKSAHQHMFITEELFELRRQLLSDALREVGLSEKLREQWLHMDGILKNSIVKTAVSDCKVSYTTQQILAFEKPRKVS